MALSADNVRQAITGAVYFDPTGEAAAPTGTASTLTGFNDLGYISEDGVSLEMPGEGDTTPIRAWQNGATVRTIRTPSEDSPALTCTFIETKLETIEAVFGVTVTQSATEGEFVINTNASRTHGRLVFDVVDGSELIRIYGPKAIVTAIETIEFTSEDAIGYGVTFALDFDEALDGQAKVWMTALKTATP